MFSQFLACIPRQVRKMKFQLHTTSSCEEQYPFSTALGLCDPLTRFLLIEGNPTLELPPYHD